MGGGKRDVVLKVLSALSFTPQVNVLINYFDNNFLFVCLFVL